MPPTTTETTTDTDDTGPVVRPFADFLRETGKGHTVEELSQGLHDLVSRVSDTGKKGTITLVVTVETLPKDDSVLVVSDQIKLKLPEHDRPSSLFYKDKDGNLTRTDPNQLSFESLREVPRPASADVSDGVNPKTGEITG